MIAGGNWLSEANFILQAILVSSIKYEGVPSAHPPSRAPTKYQLDIFKIKLFNNNEFKIELYYIKIQMSSVE